MAMMLRFHADFSNEDALFRLLLRHQRGHDDRRAPGPWPGLRILKTELKKLPVEGYELKVAACRSNLSAMKFDVG